MGECKHLRKFNVRLIFTDGVGDGLACVDCKKAFFDKDAIVIRPLCSTCEGYGVVRIGHHPIVMTCTDCFGLGIVVDQPPEIMVA